MSRTTARIILYNVFGFIGSQNVEEICQGISTFVSGHHVGPPSATFALAAGTLALHIHTPLLQAASTPTNRVGPAVLQQLLPRLMLYSPL